ncbi:MAG: tRNA (adenosine(37)-N6)-threonylcarbamoyltransferase complex dimerization subunit type 1 TsaB [Flavobacteriaceae bacterium]|nr:tRNA (adenosine(37)-N6)-threonylcarbamoyltransferase complex dimerization subunit type 1 TsaB [Flavobacteriaceae bacterium]
MALILNLETSTKKCSVCLSDKERVIALEEINEGQFTHAEKLHVFIENVFKKSKVSMNSLDAIAISKGPGSYTGLRIGVSAAKGLCFALDKPLIAIDTLEILAHAAKVERGLIVPMLDARRMEVYSAVFDEQYHKIRETEAEIIHPDSYREYLSKGKVLFLGDGAGKCADILQHENAIFLRDHFPSAKEMVPLSEARFQESKFEDVAYFEPYYLKDFIAIKPRDLLAKK